MGNNDIKVKDLSTTSSLSTANKLMLLTDEANNRVQNITVENALANIISSNANNSLSIGTDKKLYSADISGEVGDLDNLITTDKTDIVSAINEVKGDTNAITGSVVPASKGYLEYGKVYSDNTLYNNVYGYNHSTFDIPKFTVVGTPTITNDGIASGFVNSTNYIQAYSLNAMPSMLVIKAKARTENTLTAANRTAVCGKNSEDSNVRFYVRGDGSNASRLVIGYKKSDATYFNTFINVSANTEYDINITINGSNISISINGTEIVNGNNLYTANNIESIGVGSVNGNNCWLGSIDLKQLSITVDGYPVFNGNKTGIDTYTINNTTVTIPYTLSKTGSKIVDVAYRDRVIDVYQQFGSANYYTIDEVNQNATLPMGEIYGLIRQSDSDKIYKAIVPCYDSTKAISVPLLGNYTAPADGYVCSPNMVLVLDPDNGYENFSLTIMRNTQSMTMISCTGPTAFPFCLSVLKDDVLTVAADATVTSNVYFIPREGV